jgi:protein transport protein SEC61 subunit alpha
MFAFGSAVGQIWYGAYGSMESLGFFGASILVAQLLAAGLMIILLDEILSCGYGLGSGISLFIVANTAENIFWKMFSPITLSS